MNCSEERVLVLNWFCLCLALNFDRCYHARRSVQVGRWRSGEGLRGPLGSGVLGARRIGEDPAEPREPRWVMVCRHPSITQCKLLDETKGAPDLPAEATGYSSYEY